MEYWVYIFSHRSYRYRVDVKNLSLMPPSDADDDEKSFDYV